jgi:hypothetical protein
VLSFHCVCGSAHPFNSSYAYQRLFKGWWILGNNMKDS